MISAYIQKIRKRKTVSPNEGMESGKETETLRAEIHQAGTKDRVHRTKASVFAKAKNKPTIWQDWIRKRIKVQISHMRHEQKIYNCGCIRTLKHFKRILEQLDINKFET